MTKTAIVFLAVLALSGGCDQNQNLGNNLDADAEVDAGKTNDPGDGSQGHSGKYVFVTAASYGAVIGIPNVINGDGSVTPGVDPLTRADELCNAAANAAGLQGRFVAWLSAYGESAVDRIADVGPWSKLDTGHTLVFSNKANLQTTPLAPLDVDEHGQQQQAVLVWTGTTTGGRADQPNCNDWGSDYSFENGLVGSTEDSSGWTRSIVTLQCNATAHLYCFEQ